MTEQMKQHGKDLAAWLKERGLMVDSCGCCDGSTLHFIKDWRPEDPDDKNYSPCIEINEYGQYGFHENDYKGEEKKDD